jgi:predicted phosphodiesterase
MIAQIINREYVLNELKRVQAFLAAGAPDAATRRDADAKALPAAGTPEQYRAAALALDKAYADELAKSSGQKGMGNQRRGEVETMATTDPVAFFSHDPVMCMLQTALERYFLDEAPQKLERISPPTSDTRREPGSPAGSPVTDLHIKPNLEPPRPGETRRVLDEFSETDPRWVASLFAQLYTRFKGKHAFNPTATPPVKIDNKARLILVADWGSGIPRAQKLGDVMRGVVEQGIKEGRQQHVIHLGDVYYSGWDNEYRERFLPKWPVRQEEVATISSWCLNGNHDMYSGGYGYFDVLLNEPRFQAWQKGSSYFGLFNDNWDILALDTAYEDEGLFGDQADWIQKNRRAAPVKTMLLSHHQLFSAYEEGCPELQKKLKPILDARDIDVWFWGHEHRCVFYKPESKVKNARLIGHGGVPVYMTRKDGETVKLPGYYEYRDAIVTGLEHWAKFGFAVVDFDGPQLQVQYINEDGNVYKRETIAP